MTENNNKTWSAWELAWNLGWQIVVPLIVFALAGRLLDSKIGTGPWLFLAGMLLAIVTSSLLIYKKIVKILKELNNVSTDYKKSDDQMLNNKNK